LEEELLKKKSFFLKEKFFFIKRSVIKKESVFRKEKRFFKKDARLKKGGFPFRGSVMKKGPVSGLDFLASFYLPPLLKNDRLAE